MNERITVLFRFFLGNCIISLLIKIFFHDLIERYLKMYYLSTNFSSLVIIFLFKFYHSIFISLWTKSYYFLIERAISFSLIFFSHVSLKIDCPFNIRNVSQEIVPNANVITKTATLYCITLTFIAY